MIKKLKRGIKLIWQDIKDQVDFEHLGFHIENYTGFLLSTIGMVFFGLFALMEWAFYPALLVEMNMTVVASGDRLGNLFRTWPILSFAISEIFYMVGLCWSIHEFIKSFSFWDSHYKRVIELRARINDAESGIGWDGKQNEWLLSLNFQDGDTARKVANFVFLSRQLGFKVRRIKELVKDKFGKE